MGRDRGALGRDLGGSGRHLDPGRPCGRDRAPTVRDLLGAGQLGAALPFGLPAK
jgi:hypothetical protein